MNQEAYELWLNREMETDSLPRTKEIYLKYFNEGRGYFLSCLNPGQQTNPYSDSYERYPWFSGFRETSEYYFYQKYNLKEMKDKIGEIVQSHGLKIKHTDEYGTPYAITPEGFAVDLA